MTKKIMFNDKYCLTQAVLAWSEDNDKACFELVD